MGSFVTADLRSFEFIFELVHNLDTQGKGSELGWNKKIANEVILARNKKKFAIGGRESEVEKRLPNNNLGSSTRWCTRHRAKPSLNNQTGKITLSLLFASPRPCPTETPPLPPSCCCRSPRPAVFVVVFVWKRPFLQLPSWPLLTNENCVA